MRCSRPNAALSVRYHYRGLCSHQQHTSPPSIRCFPPMLILLRCNSLMQHPGNLNLSQPHRVKQGLSLLYVTLWLFPVGIAKSVAVNPLEGQRRSSIPHKQTVGVFHLAKTWRSSAVRGDAGSSILSGSGPVITSLWIWLGGLINLMEAWRDETRTERSLVLSTTLTCDKQNVISLCAFICTRYP